MDTKICDAKQKPCRLKPYIKINILFKDALTEVEVWGCSFWRGCIGLHYTSMGVSSSWQIALSSILVLLDPSAVFDSVNNYPLERLETRRDLEWWDLEHTDIVRALNKVQRLMFWHKVSPESDEDMLNAFLSSWNICRSNLVNIQNCALCIALLLFFAKTEILYVRPHAWHTQHWRLEDLLLFSVLHI